MNEIQTNLYIIESRDHVSYGTSLEKAVRSLFATYHNKLIRENNIESLVEELNRLVKTMLTDNKQWKPLPLVMRDEDYFDHKQIQLGCVVMRLHPAKAVLQ